MRHATAGQCAVKGHTEGVDSVCFSPDGKRLASGSEDGKARIWDVTIPVEDPPSTPQPTAQP